MRLLHTNTALGTKKISVKELFNNDDLIEKTGIAHVYQADESTVCLAARACRFIEKDVDKAAIELCILVTQTPDDFLPANAITLSSALGLSSKCLSLDISQGCSGFVQALCLIDKLSASYHNILLVTADRYTSKLALNDRSTNAVFSDGASATLCQHDPNFGILYEDHYTDGSKRELLFQSTDTAQNNGHLHMSGAQVWMFTKMNVVPQIKKAITFCQDNHLTINAIYIHQASRMVVDGIKASLGENIASKLHENYANQGNTVSSSIPFLLQDYPLDCKAGKEVNIFAGFGVGLTSSVIIYGKKHG